MLSSAWRGVGCSTRRSRSDGCADATANVSTPRPRGPPVPVWPGSAPGAAARVALLLGGLELVEGRGRDHDASAALVASRATVVDLHPDLPTVATHPLRAQHPHRH